LDILVAGIVGSVVLPILGAVPDGAIVLFSGLNGGQDTLSVGIGGLAGSTIMLLTIPWFLAIVAGRVDNINGKPNYQGKPKLTPDSRSLNAMVEVKPSIAKNSKIMLGTCLSFAIIQVPNQAFPVSLPPQFLAPFRL